MESLQSHCIHTQFQWSACLLPVMRDPGSIPSGVLMWNQDSSVSIVLLLWWPQRDWSFWPHLRRALSRTVTRPSWWQCYNLIILLDLTQLFCPGFTLAGGPRSGFTTDIVGCWGGALQSHYIYTQFHWSVAHPFASCHEGPGFNPQGGTYVNRDSLVSVVSLHYYNYNTYIIQWFLIRILFTYF